MAEIDSALKHIHLNNHADLLDVSSSASTSPRSSSSSFSNWRIHYKPTTQNTQYNGIWAGYQSQDEFMNMHLR